MSLTPNYGFNIPTGTDVVNLLTQCYPNFTDLDTYLKTIADTGTTVATATKVGTVFQLVRTNSDLDVIRFVATGNYNAGDSFTVDGVAVTATAVDGTALQTGAFVINQSVFAIKNGSVLTVYAGGASLPSANDVSYDNTGSGLVATNVQDAIDEVKADIPTSLAGSAITYDNTGSGLAAANVQDAIDEIASSNSGLTEVWTNPDATQSFGSQTIVLSESSNVVLVDFIFNKDAGTIRHYTTILSGTGRLNCALTTSGTAISIGERDAILSGTSVVFGDGKTQNSGSSASVSNNYIVPYKIYKMA